MTQDAAHKEFCWTFPLYRPSRSLEQFRTQGLESTAGQRCARISTEFASGSKLVDDNRGEIGISLVTRDAAHIDRALLWQVLPHIGGPAQMIAAIRQFHDGMGARVRPDDGVCSNWFQVEQGLRQRCVLSPLLFNIFFADVLTVVSQRLNKNTAILTELVHLKEQPTPMRLESTIDSVRRAM